MGQDVFLLSRDRRPGGSGRFSTKPRSSFYRIAAGVHDTSDVRGDQGITLTASFLPRGDKLLYNAVMETTTTKEETERLIRMLRTAMRLLGFTNREIERRLGYTPSYLTRLFSGQIELRFEHVVDIVRAMGMTVDEFFRFAYPDRLEKLTEAAEKLHALLEEMRPTPKAPSRVPAWGEEEFEKTIVDALRKIVREEDEQIRKALETLREYEEVVDSMRPPSKRRGARKTAPPPEPPQAPAAPRAKRKSPA
jgi:transcriptional regulator with XRE-family HTH domain